MPCAQNTHKTRWGPGNYYTKRTRDGHSLRLLLSFGPSIEPDSEQLGVMARLRSRYTCRLCGIWDTMTRFFFGSSNTLALSVNPTVAICTAAASDPSTALCFVSWANDSYWATMHALASGIFLKCAECITFMKPSSLATSTTSLVSAILQATVLQLLWQLRVAVCAVAFSGDHLNEAVSQHTCSDKRLHVPWDDQTVC